MKPIDWLIILTLAITILNTAILIALYREWRKLVDEGY